MVQQELGGLSLDFFWEVVKGRQPIELSLNIEGAYVFGVLFLAGLALIFFIGLVSRALFEYQTLKLRIKDKERELSETDKRIEECKKQLKAVKKALSEDEKKKLSDELGKVESNASITRREERTRLRHWQMLEEEYKNK